MKAFVVVMVFSVMLAAGPGSSIFIEAEGPDAPQALAALVALVEDGFGEGA